jgi:DNA-binding CsgD family transcriptional regulator
VRDVEFPHPLVRAAVYHQLGPARRVALHLAAAGLLDDQAAALRHRVAAADPPDERLAAELAALAEREEAAGAFGEAASTLMDASQMSPPGPHREDRLLQAVDVLASAGGLVQADPFLAEVAGLAQGARRDALLGLLAILRGRPAEAEERLTRASDNSDAGRDAELAALIALRRTLHSVGRMRAADITEWAGQASTLASPGAAVQIEAEALRGLGLGWLGRVQDGLRVHEAIVDRLEGGANTALMQPVRAAHGGLLVAADDLAGAQVALSEATLVDQRAGSTSNAVWAFVWQARAGFLLGAWDEAAAAAEHAVSLQEEARHEWLRPLARWAAACVPSARGDWPVAEEHVRLAAAQAGDYELMIVAAALARAHLAAARADHEAVLRALEPVLGIQPREAIDEPGCWPWQELYGDALVSAGQLAGAAAFLVPHEKLAAARGRLSTMAALARVRGRLEAAMGRSAAAEAAFRQGLDQLDRLSLPFQRALLELSYGQMLRRHGRRRAAAGQLEAAHERLTQLGGRPYLEHCERELSACGLAPAKRHTLDPGRLTAQEFAVARLVASGMSNRHVAAELYVSIKTVQFHLTHIYSKLQLSSRAELAANYDMLVQA